MFRKFLLAQLRKIEIDKWLEGIQKGYDPGQEFVITWVNTNAARFREEWDKSICKCCSNTNCMHMNREQCSTFNEDMMLND